MADNIVGGLFGVSPEQLQQQRMAQDLKEGFMLAQLSPMERATAGIYAGSKQLGRAAQGLLGMEDPQLQEAAMAKKLSENFDVNSVEGLRGLAIELQRAGSLRYSQLAAQQANQLEAASLTRQKTAADIQRTEGLISKEDAAAAQNEKLRSELSDAIQRGASRQEIRNIAAKYGSADKILQILSKEEERANALAIAAAGKPAKEDKPLPAGTVKEIATAERINNTLNRTNTTLDKYITEVDDNKIEFNLGKNIAGWVQRGTGKQDANTLKQVSLKKFLENERNNILLAAKGTQTEGDANRAMSQIFDRTDWTSNVAVSQALSDLKDYKNSQIDSNNVFMSSLRGGGLPVAPTAAPRTPPTAPQGQEFAADYAKYKAKYGATALPYEAYVAKRKGL